MGNNKNNNSEKTERDKVLEHLWTFLKVKGG